MKVIYLFLVVVLAVFLAFAGVWYSNSNVTSTPSEVVKKYYELAFDGKINEALSLWANCNPNSNGVCSNAALTSGEDTIERWTKNIYRDKDPFNIEEEKIENNMASVLVHTRFPNAFSQKTIYKLIHLNGKWVLNSLSSPAMEDVDRNTEKFRLENNPTDN